MLSKIFECQKKSNSQRKRTEVPKKKNQFGYSSEKQHQINFLHDLFRKKLNEDYLRKLSLLLYSSKYTSNYPAKRNNITETVYKFDANNELYLTLPKINTNQKRNEAYEDYTKTENNDKNYFNPNKNNRPEISKDEYDDILDENIREILYRDMDEDEERAKELYEKLQTRYENFDYNDTKNKNKKLPKIKNNMSNSASIPSDYKLIATPKQISEFDDILGKSFVNGNLQYLTKTQKEKLAYIAEFNLFNSIDRINKKKVMLNNLKNNNRIDSRKGKGLMSIDFFNYDGKKWQKITEERNKNLNEIAINRLNDDNKTQLGKMKDNVTKISGDAYWADKDVNKAIEDINIFLKKNGLEREGYSNKNIAKNPGENKKKALNLNEEKEA